MYTYKEQNMGIRKKTGFMNRTNRRWRKDEVGPKLISSKQSWTTRKWINEKYYDSNPSSFGQRDKKK